MGNGIEKSGYVQLHTGGVHNPAGRSYDNTGIGVGGKLNYKGTYLSAELAGGTAMAGKVQLGHEFDLGKNFGLDLSAKAQGSFATKRSKNDTHIDLTTTQALTYKDEQTGAVKQESATIGDRFDIHTDWVDGETRLGAGAQFTFKSKNFKIGLGAEAGKRSTIANDANHHVESHIRAVYTDNEGKQQVIDNNKVYNKTFDIGKTKTYITPTVSAELNLGKKFSLMANGDMHQQQVGIRYNF